MFLFVTAENSLGALVEPYLSASGPLVYYARPDAARLLTERKDTGGVVFDLSPSGTAHLPILSDLHTAYPELPIAVLAPQNAAESHRVSEKTAIPADLRAVVVRRIIPNLPSGTVPEIARDVLDFFKSDCGWDPAPLVTHDLTVSPEDGGIARYLGYPFALSPKERRLLYCVFYHAPRPVPVDDLLSLCYPFSPATPSTIAAVVHRVNLRAAALDPRPLLRFSPAGYVLRRGIVE